MIFQKQILIILNQNQKHFSVYLVLNQLQYLKIYNQWVAADFNMSAIKWINYYPGQHFDEDIVSQLSKSLDITAHRAWISKITPGYFAPWHWDVDDSEEQYLSKGTIKRFSIFNSSKELLSQQDYLYFLNANMLCVEDINDEIIPDEKNDYLTAVQHPGFYSQENYNFTYERNPKSKFYVSYDEGQCYFQGCFIGGRSNEFLNMSEYLDSLIDEDLSNDIIPVWWDESALNWYYKDKNPLIIDRHYAYPENHVYPNVFLEKTKILKRDKSKFGGHGFLREK